MTDQAGFEQPAHVLPEELVQQVMAVLPLEDRGRWSHADKALHGLTVSAPQDSAAGRTQDLSHRTDLPYRTIYTQSELDTSLDDPAVLRFAPGGGPSAQDLTIDRRAAHGPIRLYGGLDQQPLARLKAGRVDALAGAVITSMQGGYVEVGNDAVVTTMDGGYCAVRTGGTVIDVNGGIAHPNGGTIINKRDDGHSHVTNGRIENLYCGDAHMEGRSRCSTVHGGRLWAWGETTVGEVIDGSVDLRHVSSIGCVKGGFIEAAGTAITDVCGGIVHLYSGACVQTVTGGTVHAHARTTIRTASGGTVYVDRGSTVHQAEGNAVIHACRGSDITATGDAEVHAVGGSTVTLYENAAVHAYEDATVIAYGGTVHLHGSKVHLTDHGAGLVLHA